MSGDNIKFIKIENDFYLFAETNSMNFLNLIQVAAIIDAI